MNSTEKAIFEALGTIPGHFEEVGEDHVKIKCDDGWQGINTYKITKDDVADYWAFEARNLSGCRSLGDITGDWRMVDHIASELRAIFEAGDIEGMDKRYHKRGIHRRGE